MNISLKKYYIYILGGLINFLLKILLTVFLTEILKISYFISYLITLCVVVVYSFAYNMYLTFRVTTDKVINFLKYIVTLILFNMLDAYSVKMLTEHMMFHYTLSIIIVTSVLLVLKFMVFDKIVFSRRLV